MKISNNVYSLDCTNGGRCFIIKETDGYTLIDTGMPKLADKIMEELKTYDISPVSIKRILLTHGDVDHIGNADAIRKITNCEIYANQLEIPYLEGKKYYNLIKKTLRKVLHVKPIDGVKELPQNKIGQIQIINTPGHTPGHMCYKYGKYLFIGDLVGEKNGKISMLPKTMTYDTKQLKKSIINLNLEGVELMCPAHGNNFTPDKYINEFLPTLR
ncbi:hydrolase [Bacilli bacterium]|nr:hydrolase [Bacilli bacterium]